MQVPASFVPGFHAERFFEWIASLRPTWYSAVPTIHQAILGQVNANKDIIDANPLRFIRSSSASLPPQVMAELEEAFHAPVIESYGMTEASHQMTSNPLPPLKRKSGSVGLSAGPEVTIMDQDGNIKTTGKRGEIVIRGENVMQGYENNPEANRAAFTEGWFRTGDEGYFDSDGYLYISGRIKEIINRGGEKITPREVDEALLEHHAVAQAVTFAVPHPSLGEDVAAAVVLQQDATVSEKDLRDFAFNRLADFKVPSQIILVENIPKGPTGKLQRIGLAKRMELELQPQYVEPKSDTQRILATLMADVLKVERVGILDNFFALGGDSLLAMSFFSRIENEMERKLPLAALFQAPTVEQLAAKLEDVSWSAPWSSLVPIQSTGTRPPFFFIHAHGGNVVTYYHLAQHLDSDQPFYGLQAQALKNRVITHHRIEEMAAHYIKEIRTVQPTGPYYLGGWCMGGCIAYEMAQQLLPQGEKIALLAMVQSSHPDYPKYRKGTTSFHRLIYQALQRIDLEVSNLMEISGIRAKLVHLKNRSNGLFTTLQVSLERSLEQILGLLNIKLPHSRSYILKEIEKAHTLSYDTYEPKSYKGSAVIFYTKKQPMGIHPDNSLGWRELIKGELKLEEIPGHRIGMLTEPRVRFLAQRLQDCIDHAMTKNTT